jgi:RNA polymerase sigma-70 factor (ECF subfamily)
VVRQAAERMVEIAGSGGPPELRRVEVLRLRFGEDVPVREIARRLGGEPESVHRELARARREFRRALLEVLRFHDPEHPDEAPREAERLLALLR